MENLNIEITFIIAIAIALLGFLVFFKGTGYHSKTKKIYATIILVLLLVVSYFFPLPGSIALAILVIIYYCYYRKTISTLSMKDDDFITYEEFEANYKQEDLDESGCYIITTYSSKDPSNMNQYLAAYVGSSKKVNKEVHSILNNKMLSRVYRDINEGKYAYIRIIPVEEEQLDSNRQKLIDLYHGIPYLMSFSEVKQKQKA